MSIEDRMSAMQKLADTLNDAVSQLEGSSELLGEWQEIADAHEPEDIKEKLRALEEWDRLEYVHGYNADDVGTKLEELEGWEAVENEHGDASEVEDKLEKLEGWECIESLYGLSAGEVEEKLDELSEWEGVSNWHGSPEEVKDKLEDRDAWIALGDEFGSVEDIRTILKEHGTTDMEELKSKVEEQKVLLADFIEERDFLVQRTIDIEAELTALKNRTRWQTFLSLFTGRKS
jgi:hypothetical protein